MNRQFKIKGPDLREIAIHHAKRLKPGMALQDSANDVIALVKSYAEADQRKTIDRRYIQKIVAEDLIGLPWLKSRNLASNHIIRKLKGRLPLNTAKEMEFIQFLIFSFLAGTSRQRPLVVYTYTSSEKLLRYFGEVLGRMYGAVNPVEVLNPAAMNDQWSVYANFRGADVGLSGSTEIPRIVKMIHPHEHLVLLVPNIQTGIDEFHGQLSDVLKQGYIEDNFENRTPLGSYSVVLLGEILPKRAPVGFSKQTQLTDNQSDVRRWYDSVIDMDLALEPSEAWIQQHVQQYFEHDEEFKAFRFALSSEFDCKMMPAANFASVLSSSIESGRLDFDKLDLLLKSIPKTIYTQLLNLDLNSCPDYIELETDGKSVGFSFRH